jgi:hypothetical protein
MLRGPGLVVRSCTSHPGVLGSIPKARNQGKQAHPVLKYRVPHGPKDLDAPSRLAVQRKLNNYRQQSEHFFSPHHLKHFNPHARRIFAHSFSTGPPGDRGALHCHWNAIATQPIGLVPFQARGILPVAEEQSRTRGGQRGGVLDQPQCRGLWHSSSPSAHSLSRSPSSPPRLGRAVGKDLEPSSV